MGGLVVALTSLLAIAVYVSFQLSFDKFHEGYQNIYRINSIRKEGTDDIRTASVPSALGAALKAEIPELKSYAITSEWGQALMRHNGKVIRSSGFLEADSSIFNIFTFNFLSGNKTAISSPGGIAISEHLAKQVFGNEYPIHKIISFPDRFNTELEVRAVFKDLPANSSLQIRAIISYGALRDKEENAELYTWGTGYGGNLFVKLNDNSDLNAFTKKAQAILDKNMRTGIDEQEKDIHLFTQPLSDIYLGEPLKWEFDQKGNPTYLFIYVSLAFFLLIIATINYLNLSIADFAFRNKEVGVRKVLGARKRQIVFQIGFETIIHCFLALVTSLVVLYFVFTFLSSSLDPNLRFSMIWNRQVVAILLSVLFFLILFTAAYPAYCLSSNNPINDLKRRQVVGGSFSINKVLLVAQFVISTFCMSATWIAAQQLSYIQTRDIGFDRDNLISVFMPDRYPLEKAPVLKNEIARISGIASASFSYYHMTAVPYFNAWYKVEIGNEMKQVMLNELFVDEDFIKTMKLKLLDGRDFESKKEFKTAYIVNESAVREFGWKNPIGKKIAVGRDKDSGGLWAEGTITGVVKDFNTRSLHHKIEPLVIRLQYDDWPGYCLNIRYTGHENEIVQKIGKVYEQVLPGLLMEYGRVNERYENQYQAEKKAYNTLQLATWIILAISSIGIFSMSVFIANRRRREFGIRKVIGASLAQITVLQLNTFLKAAVVANVLALPLAYYITREWLQSFAYRTEVSPFLFLYFGLTLIALIILSAGYPAWKSGRMNPVDVIKLE